VPSLVLNEEKKPETTGPTTILVKEMKSTMVPYVLENPPDKPPAQSFTSQANDRFLRRVSLSVPILPEILDKSANHLTNEPPRRLSATTEDVSALVYC